MRETLYCFILITGTFIAAVAMYAIPVLLVCSFAFNWTGFVKFILCIGMFLQFAFTWNQIAEWGDRNNAF